MWQIDCADLYGDGRHYDLENADAIEDIPFYQRQTMRFGGPVLELACGTGRITIPIAELGYPITGLDISEAMLTHARAKSAAKGVHVEWVHADCRDFSLGRRFAFIFLPFNSIAHLHDRASLEACLARVREHLAPNGRFVVDIFNPRLELLIRDPDKRYPIFEYPDPDGRGMIEVTENNVYDRASQVNRIKWYFRLVDGGDEFVQQLNMRIFYPQELDMLLLYNGFALEAKYGDYDETPFESTSRHQVVICRAR